MRTVYHPEFARDIKRFESGYAEISPSLAIRFRERVDEGIVTVIAQPSAAGHFLSMGSLLLRDVRRRNLKVFPFFILYGLHHDRLIFASLIPSASDPLSWTDRLKL